MEKKLNIYCKRPITRYPTSEHNFLYNKNIKEVMNGKRPITRYIEIE